MTSVDKQSPVYSNGSSQVLPPTLPVGKHNPAPLVTIQDLQAHLRILGAFTKLKQDVQGMVNGSTDKEKEEAWVVYVTRAAHRFGVVVGTEWTSGFVGWKEETAPPLDVLMVLHSYLLNPLTVYEDSVRRRTFFARNLTAIGSFPVQLIASLIDPDTLDAYPPSNERKTFFERITKEPFTLPLTTATSDILSLSCPCCDKTADKVPWATGEEKGFAQPGFIFPCSSCGKEFTKPMMGIRRFADEVTRKRAKRRVYFAETLLDPKTGQAHDSVADMFIVRLLRRINAVFSLSKYCENEGIGPEARKLVAGLKWSPDVLAENLQIGLQPKVDFQPDRIIPRVSRIVAAYSNPGPASIDLVGAVLRQSTFVAKMYEMGWSKPGQIPQDQEMANLVRAVARYHAFLDLLSQSSYNFWVPTLDIDLAWHTHQLTGPTYREDTLKLLGRTPNHDDAVEQTTLQSGYDETAKASKARFGVPYSVCGCMMDAPPEKVIEKGKSSFKKVLKIGKSSSDDHGAAKTRYGTDTGHPELVSSNPDDADSSHPSDHNLHRESIAEGAAQLDRNEVDHWQKLQAERKQARTGHTEAFTEDGDGRYHAYWGVSANVPFGFWAACKYDNAAGGCSTVNASCSIGLGRDSNWMPSVPYA
ncbi:hypothetical protein CPB86DRAFT_871885 [Serendipita vermifera]|nr:hypothetical protein CPB86DRAFT_871885 [Serendipita vermifera]